MNKIIFKAFFTFLLCYLIPLTAELQTTIEIRSAAFFHSSKLFRRLYGNVGTSYELEVSTRFQDCLELDNIEIWANYDQFSKHGKVRHCEGAKTRIDIYDISLGLNYIYPFCNCFEAYAGIGSSLSSVVLKNKSCCFHEKKSKLAAGIVLKSGIVYYLSCQIFLDLFVDYLYQPVNFHHRVDVGGVKIGGGIGWKF